MAGERRCLVPPAQSQPAAPATAAPNVSEKVSAAEKSPMRCAREKKEVGAKTVYAHIVYYTSHISTIFNMQYIYISNQI